MAPGAITFDFWDTIVRADTPATRARRRRAIAAVLVAHGASAEDAAIDAAFDEAWLRFDSSWAAGRQFTGRHAAETVCEVLGHGDESLRAAVIDAYLEAPRGMNLQLTDNVATTIERLRSAGLRVGIVCDVGLTPSVVLREYLAGHGILDLFDHWSFSDEVGVYKPHAAIFDHALAGLGGVEPGDAVHIGDLRRTDIAGALGMGMLSVRYRGVTDDDPAHGPEADIVIDDHADLPAAIGL